MSYLAWAIFAEGPTDYEYLEVVIPRLLDDLVAKRSEKNVTISPMPAIKFGQTSRAVEAVAEEICSSIDAYDLLFVHGDTGGRAQAASAVNRTNSYCEAAHALCGLSATRCIGIRPRHEIEAWALCDPAAILSTVGFRGNAADLGLPANESLAESLVDPKATLTEAIALARNRRRSGRATIPHAAIAQRQSLDALRSAPSFRSFEADTVSAIQEMGWVFA